MKEVLYTTRHFGWGADTRLYRTFGAFCDEFPRRLESDGPRVIKQNRGNGGQGVWKVELAPTAPPSGDAVVSEARRGSEPKTLPLAEFMGNCAAYFADNGCIIDQPFQEQLPDGMIRCYMGTDKVVGFGHQLIKALIPPPQGAASPEAQPGRRIMHRRRRLNFRRCGERWRASGLHRWCNSSASSVIPCRSFGMPRTAAGADTYVLCEINVGSVMPIPEQAPAEIARECRRSQDGQSVSCRSAPLPVHPTRERVAELGALIVARIMPVTPIGPDSLAGALEVLIDLVADANNPDRGEPVFGSEGAHSNGDLPGAHALALHGSGFEVDSWTVFEFMLRPPGLGGERLQRKRKRSAAGCRSLPPSAAKLVELQPAL